MDRGLEHFSQEDIQKPSRYMKGWSISLAMREMHIKTKVRYHLTTVKMVTINRTRNSRCWKGYGEKGTCIHCWWEYKLVWPLWKTVWSFLKKLRIELPYAPTIPLLGIYWKSWKHLFVKTYVPLCSLRH